MTDFNKLNEYLVRYWPTSHSIAVLTSLLKCFLAFQLYNSVNKLCTGGHFLDYGYYMKFDTSSGAAGSTALLESRILYPKRNEQCLQFFYKMTGAAGDRLVIWIRTDDGTGTVRTVRKIHTITGILFDHLCLMHSPH